MFVVCRNSKVAARAKSGKVLNGTKPSSSSSVKFVFVSSSADEKVLVRRESVFEFNMCTKPDDCRVTERRVVYDYFTCVEGCDG